MRSDGALRRRDAFVVVAVALAARLAFVAWAWSRVPPAADGTFYDIIARRIAAGLGYTWLWPDGTVTHAAHYPVGYPALMAFGYAVFGANPGVVMVENALVGALLPWAVHRAAARYSTRAIALAAGLVTALHPALVSYTPALMTEGVTSALVAVAVALAAAPRPGRVAYAALAGVLGLATYLRPQCILLAPLLPIAAALATRVGVAKTLAVAALVSLGALAVVAPWTARNCRVLDDCALVSVNGGWNLLIGTDPDAHGTWAELKVPAPCRDVFDEAGKDACFGREARRRIAESPVAWLSLSPAKLSATFDYFGAGPGYLRSAAPDRFSERAKLAWLWAETIVQRLLVAAGLFGVLCALVGAGTKRARLFAWVAAIGLAALPHAAPAYVLLGLGALLAPLKRRTEVAAVPVAGAVILATALVHAVFFGAGRYGLVVVAPTALLAAFGLGARAGSLPRHSAGGRQGF